MRIVAETDPSLFHVEHEAFPCAIGRSGACSVADKREGDGFTPLGRWPIRAALLRPGGRFSPPAFLPWRWLRPDDGWSDSGRDPAYNRPVRHPHVFSAERMWRDDGRYDAVLMLGYNDDPPVPDRGSAIFLHLRGVLPTEGCIAIDYEVMEALLPRLTSASVLEICRHIGDPTPLG
ncbi:L,D-transpeptidase family protein [Sphingomonas sp. CGMCC 1.13654]|uniref:L,D-transpeptidase family protein n=1 Tax=Sphingomonas chungangi TaxID=2683589 RepID=A0A838LDD5_9SPHN|nr:L,D-transpeptidase family protein [Sphingomonas chungangi]MBA2935508.1 L,D-transpeptidase family protein [Sphingomonas chungangi]MVW57015.1 L,D-transpeptidase family protein [Sphingomonas chungangi]